MTSRMIQHVLLLVLLIAGIPAHAWKMESGTINMPGTSGTTFYKVNFQQKFDTTPMIFSMATNVGGDPATLRIRNVDINDGATGSFEISVVEPPGNDGPHAAMSVHYFAIEPGSYTLNGSRIEVGSINSSAVQHGNSVGGAESWDSISFAPAFSATPAFLAQIQTMNNETAAVPGAPSVPWLTTAVDNLDSNSADLALERSDVNNGSVSVAETIGYIAMDATTSNFVNVVGATVNFQSIVTGNNFDGWDNGCDTENFSGGLFSVSPLVMATKITHRSASDSDGGWLRRCSLSASAVGLTVDEDRDDDNERSHNPREAAGIIAFSQQFVYDSTITPPQPDPNWKLEVAEITLPLVASGSTTFNSISFQQSYDDIPLVFVLPSTENPDPAAIRVRNITTSGFQIAQVEPPPNFGGSNGQPATTVHYLAIEPGIHQLPGGINIDAGSVNTQSFQNKLLGGNGWQTISYRTAFASAPAILAQVQTMANESGNPPGSASTPWLESTVTNVTTGSFRLALDRAEVTAGTVSTNETIAYLAITANVSGSLIDLSNTTINFESILSADSITGNCSWINFANTYPSPPLVLANRNKRDGGDGGWLRRCLIQTNRVQLEVDEDRANDSERNHTTESAGIMVFSQAFKAQIGCGPVPGTYPIHSGGQLDVKNNVTMNTANVATGTVQNSVDINANRVNVSQRLPALDPSSFPGNSSTDDVTVSGTVTFDSNVKNDYRKIDVGINDTANFIGGGPFYIDELTLDNSATVNFAAGIYYINKVILKDSATINVSNAPVRMYIGNEFKVDKKDVTVNSGGNVDGFIVFLYQSAKFTAEKKNFNFTGLVYGPNSGAVKIKDAVFRGAIIAGGNVDVDKSDFTFTAGDQTSISAISTCIASSTSLAYFVITHDGYGINCVTEPSIRVAAIDSSGSAFDANGIQITLDTQQANGNWGLQTGTPANFNNLPADDGLAVYTFAAGETFADFTLNYQSGSASLDLDAFVTSNTGLRDDDSEGTMEFNPSGFTLTSSALGNPPPASIPAFAAQTAGTSFDVHITAYGQTPTDSVCGVIEAYTGAAAKNLQFWFEYMNPINDSDRNVSITDSVPTTLAPADDGEASAIARQIVFTNGQAIVQAKYKDVGQIQLNFKDINPADPNLPTGIRGGANLVSTPADIVITEVRRPDGTGDHLNVIADTTETDILKAGEPFAVKVEVRDAEGTLTPNYGYEATNEAIEIISSSLVAPAGGRNGILNTGAIVNDDAFGRWDYDGLTALADGEFLGTSFSFDEVGIIQLQASIDDDDYLGEGEYTGTASTNVGRFVPYRLDVSDNIAGFGNSCVSFTYMDQPFSFVLDPIFTITAQNSLTQTTQNYDRGGFWRLSSTLASRSYTNTAVTNATFAVNSSGTSISLAGDTDSNGIGTLTISGETFSYQRPAAVEVPVTALVDMGLTAADLSDDDGSCYDPGDDGTCDAYSINAISGTTSRFGRLRISNAFGSEQMPLNLPVVTEYIDASNNFITTADDSCTVLTALPATPPTWGNIELGNYTGSLTAASTTPGIAAFVNGATTVQLSASAPASGSVGVILRLENDAGLPGADMPWLRFDWDGDGAHDNNPSANATFGIYSGNDATIYIREVY